MSGPPLTNKEHRMKRNSVEQNLGYAWALGATAWLLLVGVAAIVVPVGLLFGEEAGRYALIGVASVSLAMTWLFAEAVHALKVDSGEMAAAPISCAITSRPSR